MAPDSSARSGWPAWVASGCWWYTLFAVALFVLGWSPNAFYFSGRHRFHWSVEPCCALEVPSEESEIGWLVGPGVDDLPTITRKLLLAELSASDCHNLEVADAVWDSSRKSCEVQLRLRAASFASPRTIQTTMADTKEYGIESNETCALLLHPKTKSQWLYEDVCVRKGGDVVVVDRWQECVGEGDVLHRGKPAFGIRGNAAGSAWFHVVAGNVYFVLGVLQFRTTGSKDPRQHKTLGRIYALLNVGIYLSTIGVTVYTATNVVRVILNVFFINNYWLWTLYRAIQAIKSRDVASHRAWMMRNFSTAFAIVSGRYWGTALLLVAWPLYGSGTAAGDGNIMLSTAAHIVLVECFLAAETKFKSKSDKETAQKQT